MRKNCWRHVGADRHGENTPVARSDNFRAMRSGNSQGKWGMLSPTPRPGVEFRKFRGTRGNSSSSSHRSDRAPLRHFEPARIWAGTTGAMPAPRVVDPGKGPPLRGLGYQPRRRNPSASLLIDQPRTLVCHAPCTARTTPPSHRLTGYVSARPSRHGANSERPRAGHRLPGTLPLARAATVRFSAGAGPLPKTLRPFLPGPRPKTLW